MRRDLATRARKVMLSHEAQTESLLLVTMLYFVMPNA